jgi:hypothetical protein
MKKFAICFAGALAMLAVSPAMAKRGGKRVKAAKMGKKGGGAANQKINIDIEEIKDFTEDAVNSDCGQKLKAEAQKVGPLWKNMRSGCAQLRGCKKTCRQAKRAGNKPVRAAKRDCKKECKGKKGKAKRQCKKSCRQAARGAKKDNRKAARNCKSDCRAQYKDSACRSGRKAFWKGIANGIKSAGPACFQQIKAWANG